MWNCSGRPLCFASCCLRRPQRCDPPHSAVWRPCTDRQTVPQPPGRPRTAWDFLATGERRLPAECRAAGRWGRLRLRSGLPFLPCRQSAVRRIPGLSRVHSVPRRPEALYCLRGPCRRHFCPRIWPPAGRRRALRHRSAYRAGCGRPGHPR